MTQPSYWVKEFSEKEKQWARDWLSNVKMFIEQLGDDKYFNINRLACLIHEEMKGKKRERLLRRIHGRFCKLRNKQEWERIHDHVRKTS